MDLALGELKDNTIEGIKFMRKKQFRRNILSGFKFILADPQRSLGAILLSILGFVGFLALSSPIYSINMIMKGYILYLFNELLWVLQDSSGIIGLILTILYSIAFGVVMFLTYKQIRVYNRGIKNTLAVIPGVLMTGCVGCGTGVLGLIGAVGFNFALPFGGNSIRFIGIVLFLMIMGFIGDPTDHTQHITI